MDTNRPSPHASGAPPATVIVPTDRYLHISQRRPRGGASGTLVESDIELDISGDELSIDNTFSRNFIQSLNLNELRLSLRIIGAATTEDTLKININSNSIFDSAGNPMVSNQVTSTVNLNDITAPFITEARVIDEKTLTLTLNEPAFTSDGSLIAAADLMLSLNTGSATLESQTPESLVQEGSTFTISFNLTGSISASQTIRIGLTNPIQDATGNTTSTFNINHILQLIPDSDQDGVPDDIDSCPETPSDEAADEKGCSISQRDDDQDGVNNGNDDCPDTPSGVEVDEKGCSDFQNDVDQDGVPDNIDQCLGSEPGAKVDENGCARVQTDEDLDGVKDIDDRCLGTAIGETVDDFGCSLIQKDGDLDGVGNEIDLLELILGTIDNDIFGTRYTLGYDTAINTVVEAIDKIRDTASSHNRLFFVEVMGRDVGHIALNSGIGAGAEEILIPEENLGLPRLLESLKKSEKSGKSSSIVVVAEGDKTGKNVFEIASYVEQNLPYYEVRVSVLGHMQRGGSPSCFDRVLASRMGVFASPFELMFF